MDKRKRKKTQTDKQSDIRVCQQSLIKNSEGSRMCGDKNEIDSFAGPFSIAIKLVVISVGLCSFSLYKSMDQN